MTDFGGHEIGQSPPFHALEGRYWAEFGADQIRPTYKVGVGPTVTSVRWVGLEPTDSTTALHRHGAIYDTTGQSGVKVTQIPRQGNQI